MSNSRQQSSLVQKLIMLYDLARSFLRELLSIITKLDILFYTQDGKTSDSCYPYEISVSKLRNPHYYLGKYNIVSEESPRCAVFVIPFSLNFFNSYEYLPFLSNVKFSIGSCTSSREFIAFWKWQAIIVWWIIWDFYGFGCLHCFTSLAHSSY